MRDPRKLAGWAAFLLLAPLGAGCIGSPEESTTPPTGTTTTPTPPTTNGRVAGFRIEGLAIGPDDGANRTLREDDRARISYTLTNPGTEGSATFLVSYIENGEIKDLPHLTLKAGESKRVERTIDDLRGVTRIDVEVRAGNEKATASATVTAWPRTGDRVDLGPVVLTVNRWLKNATDGWTDVNITAERKLAPDGNYSMLRVRILCADAAGKVEAKGEARPNVPEPGTSAMSDVHLPGCDGTLYGVEFSGKDAAEASIYVRILFVESGWRPPTSSE